MVGRVAFIVLALWPGWAGAYSLRSGLTKSCHEVITARAFELDVATVARTVTLVPPAGITIPDGRTWTRMSEALFEGSGSIAEATRDDPVAQLVYLSLMVGVRSPDTEGHSITNLNSLRRIHADPSAAGQYAHSLRGPDDDDEAGNEEAIKGTKATIQSLVEAAQDAHAKPVDEQIITVEFYFDFYGLVDLEVWAPAYYLGRAAHAVQDSFSHTIRGGPGLTQILHVMNFVDAITGDLDEAHDGLAHSDAMDHCVGDTEPIVTQATQATGELFAQAAALFDGTPTALDDFFITWFGYAAGCDKSNDYCESEWVAIARQEVTGPYLGCAGSGSVGWLALLVLLVPLRRRVAALGLLVTVFVVPQARADEWFAQVEGHLSTISDAPNRSVFASTFGYGVRSGWRGERWGMFGLFERNYWLATDLDAGVFAGALDVGVGAELLFAGGRLRTSGAIGASILMEDTPLHDAGQRGGFGDLRPIEFRWCLYSGLHATLTPLGLTVVSPVLSEPSIRMLQYRTTGGLEYVF